MRWQEGNIEGVICRAIPPYIDERGWLCEVFRQDECDPAIMPTMGYVSLTRAGVIRGPHEHREQSDWFAFIGPGTFRIRAWDARAESPTYGYMQTITAGADAPTAVVIPPGVVHAYRNVGETDGYVLNFPNRLYAGHGRQEEVDEIRHEDAAGSPYVLD